MRVRCGVEGAGCWSDVNPAAQHAARAGVLSSTDGARAWSELAAAARKAELPFEVHLWLADPARNTACEWAGAGGVAAMVAELRDARARVFDGAGHSVHREALDEYAAALEEVVRRVAP